MTWLVATVEQVVDETKTARTVRLAVPNWPGHLAGQHVDVRLTAEDGYQAVRSYSIASAADGPTLELTVDRVDDGEVSPYLVDVVSVGDQIEVRGPVGGWFVWRAAQTEPLQLIGGGSGIVPLMAMIRTRMLAGSTTPVRLLYSVRRPDLVIYRAELDALAAAGSISLTYAYTRAAPAGWPSLPARVNAALLGASAWAPADHPAVFVCGPTGFVEAVNDLLVAGGYDEDTIKAERFGPTGGAS
jgi:ferredoxin-NADP reductase